MATCLRVALLLLPVLSHAQDPSQQPLPQPQDLHCISPAGQETACVKLNACRPLLDLLRQGRERPLPLPHVEARSGGAGAGAGARADAGGRGGGRAALPDPEATAILRRLHCGFQGNTVMVCCPPDDLQSFPRAKPAGAGTDRQDEVSFSGPSAYPGQTSHHTGAPQEIHGHAPVPVPSQPHPQAESAFAAAPTPTPARPTTTAAPLDSKKLALLPTEVCGLSAQPHDHPAPTNRTALLQYPWMARLGYRQAGGTEEYLCSGSLIAERYVLTAAHCIGVQNGPTSVRVGEQDAETDPDCSGSMCAPHAIDIDIEETIAHESYSRGTNDIALIRLAKPVTFSEAVSPICLPVSTHDNPVQDLVGKSLTVTGWGKSAPNRRLHSPSRWLMQTRVPVAEEGRCSSAYSGADDVEFSHDTHLCVGGQGQSSCQGDSGSPLVLAEPRRGPGPQHRVVQHGVLSYGLADCVLRAAPVVYTRVAHFLPWILRHLQPAPFVPKDVTSGSGFVDPRRQEEH